MKTKIETGDEIVGWYFNDFEILPYHFYDLTYTEQSDYITEDDERSGIWIEVNFEDYELFFDKSDLLKDLICRKDTEIYYREKIIDDMKCEIKSINKIKNEYQKELEKLNEN